MNPGPSSESRPALPYVYSGGVVKALAHFGAEPFYIMNSDTVWVEGVGHALDRMIARWNAGTMDALLLMASMATALGFEGPGDFNMDPDGHLTRVAEHRPDARHGEQKRLDHPRPPPGLAITSR